MSGGAPAQLASPLFVTLPIRWMVDVGSRNNDAGSSIGPVDSLPTFKLRFGRGDPESVFAHVSWGSPQRRQFPSGDGHSVSIAIGPTAISTAKWAPK